MDGRYEGKFLTEGDPEEDRCGFLGITPPWQAVLEVIALLLRTGIL
jgi:hypothetical protein